VELSEQSAKVSHLWSTQLIDRGAQTGGKGAYAVHVPAPHLSHVKTNVKPRGSHFPHVEP
jgi:hypothetical protein